ncbi:unnamed protein product, partial [Rotaria sp. Silwood2]
TKCSFPFRNPPYKDIVKPYCDGLWMEFGVFRGGSISHIAKWKTTFCVPSNVVLVKGLFIDTLPIQLRIIDRKQQCRTPVSFVHIDCDIYDGARDILFLLGSRFVPGTILVFDELFNYPSYEKHEIKALFEFLSGSNLRLRAFGTSDNIELKPHKDLNVQSFAFATDSEEG